MPGWEGLVQTGLDAIELSKSVVTITGAFATGALLVWAVLKVVRRWANEKE